MEFMSLEKFIVNFFIYDQNTVRSYVDEQGCPKQYVLFEKKMNIFTFISSLLYKKIPDSDMSQFNTKYLLKHTFRNGRDRNHKYFPYLTLL